MYVLIFVKVNKSNEKNKLHILLRVRTFNIKNLSFDDS